MKKTVTAIITSYHRDRFYAERSLDSVFHQSIPVDEVILVDDNEPESDFRRMLIQLVREQGPKVSLLHTEGHTGACHARNCGLEHAQGDYVAYLDDDDVWLPEKTEKQLIAGEKRPDAALIYGGGYKVIEETGETKDYYNWKWIRENQTFQDLLIGDRIGSTSQPMIRRDVLLGLGGFREDMPARQDYEMWLRIAREYPVIGIQERLFLHNMHEGEQISQNPEKVYRGYSNLYREFYREYKAHTEAEMRICKKMAWYGKQAGASGWRRFAVRYRLLKFENRFFTHYT